MHAGTNERPWTVYVLTGWILIGAVVNLLTSGDNLLIPAVWFIVGLVLAAAFWRGARWAYTWSFMLTSLCVGFIVAFSLVQLFLLEQTPGRAVLVSLVGSSVVIALLLHPHTKRFARVEERPPTSAAPAS